MKLDILAFGVHPDDIELSCAGTLLVEKGNGKKVGIVDLTKGELGTRGNAQTRKEEAENSAIILGVDVRENLEMADGFFKNDSDNQLKIIKVLRKYAMLRKTGIRIMAALHPWSPMLHFYQD